MDPPPRRRHRDGAHPAVRGEAAAASPKPGHQVGGLPRRRGQATWRRPHRCGRGLVGRCSGAAGPGAARLVGHPHEECEPRAAQGVDSGLEAHVPPARLESRHHGSVQATEAGVRPPAHPEPSAMVAQGQTHLGVDVEVLASTLQDRALDRCQLVAVSHARSVVRAGTSHHRPTDLCGRRCPHPSAVDEHLPGDASCGTATAADSPDEPTTRMDQEVRRGGRRRWRTIRTSVVHHVVLGPHPGARGVRRRPVASLRISRGGRRGPARYVPRGRRTCPPLR